MTLLSSFFFLYRALPCRLDSQTPLSACLSLPSAGIPGMYHHAWPIRTFRCTKTIDLKLSCKWLLEANASCLLAWGPYNPSIIPGSTTLSTVILAALGEHIEGEGQVLFILEGSRSLPVPDAVYWELKRGEELEFVCHTGLNQPLTLLFHWGGRAGPKVRHLF